MTTYEQEVFETKAEAVDWKAWCDTERAPYDGMTYRVTRKLRHLDGTPYWAVEQLRARR